MAFLQVPQLVQRLDAPAPSWTSWLRIGLGVLALVGGVIYWRRSQSSTQTPRWAGRIKRITPRDVAFKREMDPHGVLNPGKLNLDGVQESALQTSGWRFRARS